MAYYEDIVIDQGTDVAIEIHLADKKTKEKKNLSNHLVQASMKRNYSSDSADTVNFGAIVASPPTDGIIILSLTNTQTDLLNAKRPYVYDVEISFIDSDEQRIVERVMEGKVYVTPSVTRIVGI